MENPTIIAFVRHGEVYNPNNVSYGRLSGFPLSRTGCLQAAAAKEYLREKQVSAIFSSSLKRAHQTAKIILGAHPNVKLHLDDMLIDAHTPYDGVPVSEVENRSWDVYKGASIEYEQPKSVLSRFLEFLRMVFRKYPSKYVVAVTHGDLIAFSILWARNQPLTTINKQKLYKDHLSPGSITTFAYHGYSEDGLLELIENCVSNQALSSYQDQLFSGKYEQNPNAPD